MADSPHRAHAGLLGDVRAEYDEMGEEWDEATVPEVARVAGLERFTIVGLTRHLEAAGFAVQSALEHGTLRRDPALTPAPHAARICSLATRGSTSAA